MTASANNNPPTIESLAKNQHRIIDVVEALSDGVATLTGNNSSNYNFRWAKAVERQTCRH